MTQSSKPLAAMDDLFLSHPHPCPYLPGQQETLAFTVPSSLSANRLAAFIAAGFRRSGKTLYRPACFSCSACLPARVKVCDFQQKARFRRILAKNADLTRQVEVPRASPLLYELFFSYVMARHSDGPMGRMDFGAFRELIEEGSEKAVLYCWYDVTERPVAALLADRLPDGLSAIYSFFDPRSKSRSLGTFMILSILEELQAQDLAHLYLGYYVEKSRKMAYKIDFQPLELLISGHWSLVR